MFDDRLLFYRERGAGVYGSVPYWFSSSIAYVLQCAAASITYSVIVYFMSGLRASAGACRVVSCHVVYHHAQHSTASL